MNDVAIDESDRIVYRSSWKGVSRLPMENPLLCGVAGVALGFWFRGLLNQPVEVVHQPCSCLCHCHCAAPSQLPVFVGILFLIVVVVVTVIYLVKFAPKVVVSGSPTQKGHKGQFGQQGKVLTITT
jgi:hypothetical protein